MNNLNAIPSSSSICAQTSWASFTSNDSTDLKVDTESSFTSGSEDVGRHPSFATNLTSPLHSPTTSTLPSALTRRRLAPPLRLNSPSKPSVTKRSTSAPPSPILILRRFVYWVLCLLIICASYNIYGIVRLPPLPNFLAAAQLLATHVEIARDVCLDVEVLRAKADHKDFKEHDMIQLARVLRPFSDQAAQGLEVSFRTILQIKHALFTPTSRVATKVNNVANQIRVMIPMIQQASRASQSSFAGRHRDLSTEQLLSSEFKTYLTSIGHERISELHQSLVNLSSLAQVLTHLLQTHILPNIPISLGPFAQPLPTHEGGLWGWWRRAERMREWKDGEFGREREARRRAVMVEKIKTLAQLMEDWVVVVNTVEQRVGNWLNAEGLWVTLESLPSPSSSRHHVFVEGYPHLSSGPSYAASASASDSDNDHDSFVPPVNVDSVFEDLRPTLDELQKLIRKARVLAFEPVIDKRVIAIPGVDYVELNDDEIVEEIWKWQVA
ncbi:hypothetical protein FRB95_002679 [Tulasnella sp. JGI-2019a]|nr:hypothetical protein FRB95_002679 [Tulasnella sp. JGI-2019a]